MHSLFYQFMLVIIPLAVAIFEIIVCCVTVIILKILNKDYLKFSAFAMITILLTTVILLEIANRFL